MDVSSSVMETRNSRLKKDVNTYSYIQFGNMGYQATSDIYKRMAYSRRPHGFYLSAFEAFLQGEAGLQNVID